MTCIVGFTDKKTGITYLGGDSLGSNGYTKSVCQQKKVFHSKDCKELILGISGRFNFQGLEYENLLNETKLLKGEINREYLITEFIPNLMKLVSKYNSNEYKNGINDMEGSLLFGYKDKLFKIQSDYSLFEVSDDYDACGSGEYFALGSLATTEDTELTPIDKIHKALQSASKFSTTVAPPYYIINTSNDEVVEFKE